MQSQSLLEFDTANPRYALEVIDTAEDNFNSILATANKVQQVFSQLRGSGFQVAPIQGLVSDLQTIFAFIRRGIFLQDAGLNRSNRRAAPLNDKFPKHIRLDSYTCLCPLTTLLREISSALSRLQIINHRQNGWGSITPLRSILVSLGRVLTDAEVPIGTTTKTMSFWPGVAQCILFHEQNSEYTVYSSAVRYHHLPGLSHFGKQVRLNHIRKMRNQCPPEVQLRIQDFEERSTDVYHHFDAITPRDGAWGDWQDPFQPPRGSKARVDGNGATFDSKGRYKPACKVDHLRFDMNKPTEAQKREDRLTRKKNSHRPAFEADSCAEWELFVTKLFSPGAQQPPTLPPPVARRQGMPKSSTFTERPQPGYHGAMPPKSKTQGWEAPPGWQPPAGRWNPPPQTRLTQQRPPMAMVWGPTPMVPRPTATDSRPMATPSRPVAMAPRPMAMAPKPNKKVKTKSRTCCFF